MLTALLCEQKIQTLFQKISHQRSEAWNLDPARWDWSSGVGHFGLLEVYRATGDRAVLDYLETWLGRVADQRKFGSVNNVILANVPLLLLQQGRGQGDRTICTEYARWCHEGSQRTSNGGWAHVWEGGDPDYRHQLWIDTMFMGVVFLARHGVAFQQPADLAEALKQLIIHLDCLFDEKAGLFRHAYHCEQKILLGEHWSRGNGWMVASIVELLELLATREQPLTAAKQRFAVVMETAYRVRAEGGLLRTLPLVGEAYLETTGSALFGYAALRGHALGLLDQRFLHWGRELAETVAHSIDSDGNIARCSYGTDPKTREVYLGLPYCQSLYADGIALMLLARAMMHLRG